MPHAELTRQLFNGAHGIQNGEPVTRTESTYAVESAEQLALDMGVVR